MDAAIRIQGLVKRYGKVEAVNGLDLEVYPGECFGLLGPNGAGKTTTIEILEGLLEPTSGTVEVLGLRWDRDATTLRARIGIALQETRVWEKLTVEEVVRLFRSFYTRGVDVEVLMTSLQLTDKRGAWVQRLSGGQRQRLAVALGLVGNPDVLFLDEPTTGLDPQSRRALWDILADLKVQGRTVVLTTHYMDEAERLCDRVGIVDHGRVIALGTPSELIEGLGGHHVVELATDPPLAEEVFAGLPSIHAVRPQGDGWMLTLEEPHLALPALFARLAEHRARPTRLLSRTATLDDVFVARTGRTLREE